MPERVGRGLHLLSQRATHPEGLLYLSQRHGAPEEQQYVNRPENCIFLLVGSHETGPVLKVICSFSKDILRMIHYNLLHLFYTKS